MAKACGAQTCETRLFRELQIPREIMGAISKLLVACWNYQIGKLWLSLSEVTSPGSETVNCEWKIKWHTLNKCSYLIYRHDGDDQESASGQQVHFDQAAHSGDLKMTSKFEKLKNRLQRKVIKRQRPSKRKKSGSSPFLEPSQGHSSVDMNGEEGRC